MKNIVWGTRTLARQLGVSRDTIRDMISRRDVTPSRLKRGGTFYCVFDGKDQKKVKECLTKKKRTYIRRSFSA